MTKWFRFYADAMRNPKVAALSDREFRLWVQVLSVASENDGRIPAAEELKHMLKARLDHLLTGLERLLRAGLIDRLGVGYEPHNWSKFQYKSDTSTDRVQKHRSKGNVSVTPPEADTETEKKEPTAQHPIAAAPRNKYERLQEQLCEAAGLDGFRAERNVGLLNLAPIIDLIERGYVLEVDILPVIREIALRGVKFNTWSYCVKAVVDRAAARSAIPQRPQAPSVDWHGRVAAYQADGTWIHAWGPKPGERGCNAPAELIQSIAA